MTESDSQSDSCSQKKPGFLEKPGFCDGGECGFAARDFFSTPEGLFFAVVANGIEDGRVLSFLRYRHDGQQFHKLHTEAAQELLSARHAQFLYHSQSRDADLHGVPPSRIVRHYVPQERVQVLKQEDSVDRVSRIAMRFVETLVARGVREQTVGVTGSLLIGAQHDRSDIDIVISDRAQFQLARDTVRELFEEGAVEPLTEEFWRSAWMRRAGSLSCEEYVWHERRKFNKLSVDGVKVDLSVSLRDGDHTGESFRKLERVELTTRVVDDAQAFDYPAVWKIDAEIAPRIECWTPTYTGQATAGETIRVRGWLEESAVGARQVVVGTSREAAGEFIAVVRE